MTHVFISYVRENYEMVQRLCDVLRTYDISVWLDKNQLRPGTRWADAIQEAISGGAYFIACFSNAYNERSKTYMNEELTLAVEELRQRPTDQAWFIPVLLDDCEVPNRKIGAGETLRSLQWVELYKDWDSGVVRILSVIQPNSAKVHQLIQALGDKSARTRIRAADDLGSLGALAKVAVPMLTQTLDDSNETVRAAAADALGKIGQATKEVIAKLVNTVKYGEYYASKHATASLAKLGAPAVPAIIQTTPDALAMIDDPMAVPLLIEALKHGYTEAASGLGRIGKAAKTAVPALINIDTNASTQALGAIGDSAAVPTLIERLRGKDYWTRVYAAEALGEIGDPSAIPSLLLALTSNDDSVILAAARSLIKIGTAEAVEGMIPLVVRNMTRYPPDNAEQQEIWNYNRIRANAADILGEIGDPSFVPLLKPLLKEEWGCFKSAAESLVKIGTPDAIEEVIPELATRLNYEDENDFNRKTAIRLLGEIGRPDFIPLLVPMLSNPDAIIVSLAKEALQKIGTPEAMKFLKT